MLCGQCVLAPAWTERAHYDNRGTRLIRSQQGYVKDTTFNTGGLSDLRLQTTDSPPAATANVDYILNLPASAVPPPVAPFDPNDPNTFNQATSLTLYDSLGVNPDKFINRSRAMMTLLGIALAGLIAWWAWLLVHIFFLIGFRNRVLVILEWAWAYLTWHRGARLITAQSWKPADDP